MITDCSIEVDAPASVVWGVFSDVEQWPSWTASVTRLTALDRAELAVGRRFEIVQPRMPKLVWEVTALTPGASWTWRQRSFGATTEATHEVEPLGPERTLVRQRLDQRGPLGAVVALVSRRLTRRYLDLEASGLKRRSEQQHATGRSEG
jgi:uncharacterized membrane protein